MKYDAEYVHWMNERAGFVTRITTENPAIADTLLTGRQYRPATEGKQMKLFTDTTGTQNLTKIIVVALALAFLATVLS